MNKFISNSKLFLKRNSSTILTCVGAAGVIASAVLAAKATPKALELIKANEEEKGEKLTKWETIKTAAPAYIPTTLMCASTIACIFGANALNKRTQAALVSAYTVLDNSYREYREHVKELNGENADNNIMSSIVRKHYAENGLTESTDGEQWFFDFYSMQFFRSTPDKVSQAEDKINDILSERGWVALGELYEAWGIPNWEVDYTTGWSLNIGHYVYGYNEIEFIHNQVTMDNGEKCTAIIMPFEPTADFYM